MASDGGPRSVLAQGGLAVLLVAVAAVLLGHVLWSTPTTVLSSPTPNRLFEPFGSRGTGGAAGSAEGSDPSAGPPASSGSGAAESGGSTGSSSGVSNSITAKVDPALVDINTELGLQSGQAAGTGMVVTAGGEVITNNHVIAGATRITATDVGNGVTYNAHVVGYDYGHDVAVLQLEDASGLQTVSFGNSASLEVGQSIATIGNAGGVGGTPSATSGHVSALDQSITAGDEVDGAQEHLSGLVRLDGEVEPGDSGGPLVNGAGEVVGMDTAASSTFQLEASGSTAFAIPSNEVRAISEQIVDGHGSSTVHIGQTALIGVLVGGQGGEGAVVQSVRAGTPAAASGLSPGDVITAVDGTSIGSPTALTELMLGKHPGDSVRVEWNTEAGVQQSATITLGNGPPQ
jgi:S1-C subfamily serine protease